MAKNLPKRPSNRQGFKIAIICALTLEADMVEMVLDHDWAEDGIKYGKAPGDMNTYTTGTIADHNVVLAYCSSMGSNSATQAVTGLKASFTQIKIAFVVGICGISPYNAKQEEIVLGDCIVSTAVVQFDLGRRGPRGFEMKNGIDGLSRAGIEIRTLLNKLTTYKSRLRLTKNLTSHLQALQKEDPTRATYPSCKEDRLFESSYLHEHRSADQTCTDCNDSTGICSKNCETLRCDHRHLVFRDRLTNDTTPSIHFGRFGSSNTVLKSGLHRDALVKEHDVIAFEMEGSGVWDSYPTIVIKAACDYADSHKNKKWQPYAAAVSATGLKAILQELELSDDEISSIGVTDVPQKIASDSVSELVQDADKAIQNYYNSGNRLQIERLSGEKLSLEKCYINLGLVSRSEQKQVRDSEASFSLEARLKLVAEDPAATISLEDLFLKSNAMPVAPRRIYIQGRAGIGKTTLCKKIVYEFLHGLWSELFDRLLWIPLRSLKSKQSRYEWQDLLQNAFSPRAKNWEKLVDALGTQLLEKDFLARTLLLFDGLDEIAHRWTREDEMFKFVEGIICDSPNIIVTSRPQANSLDIGRFDMDLETIGFSPAQVDAYLENCINDDISIQNMKALIAEKPLIQGLLRIPIQLDAFCCVWPATAHSGQVDTHISTMTMLYQSITNELFRKDVERLQRAEQPRRLAEFQISTHLEKELVFMEEYAFQGMMNGIATFIPKHRNRIDFHLFGAKSRASSDLDSLNLERLSFLRTSDVERDISKRNYHFLHLTFQEFFAARHFVHHWCDDIELIHLDLVSAVYEEERTISPVEFLQTQKYNPRFNIFWRFVTGLVQARFEQEISIVQRKRSNKHKNIFDLFNELNNEPIDLLGKVHRQLMMYCLSEVVSDNNLEIQALRAKEEDLLLQWIITEINIKKRTKLAKEVEFPENILCTLLQNNNISDFEAILSAIEARPFVGIPTLGIVSKYLDDKLATEIWLRAIGIVFKNIREESREIVAQALRLFSMLIRNHEKDVQGSAFTYFLNYILPVVAVDALIAAIKNEHDERVQWCAYRFLDMQRALSTEAIAALIAIVKDKNAKARKYAIKALFSQSYLPAEGVNALITILQDDEDALLQACAVEVLGRQHSLPVETMTILTAMLEDTDTKVRDNAITALEWALPMSSEATASLIAFLDDEDADLRKRALGALGGGFQQLPEGAMPAEAIDALIAVLQNDKDAEVRSSAAFMLRHPPSLPAEAIATLIAMLKDKDVEVRHLVTTAFIWKKTLPEEAIAALIEVIRNDMNSDMRDSAIDRLASLSSLSAEVISTFITTLHNDEDARVRYQASQGLQAQSCLPTEAIAAFTRALQEDTDTDVQYDAAEALGFQSSLSAETIAIIISQIEMSFAYDALHRHSLFYSGIKDLDNHKWLQLWSYWNEVKYDDNICCYEFKGCLHIWSEGVLYDISIDPLRTKELLEVVRSDRSLLSQATTASLRQGSDKGLDVLNTAAVLTPVSEPPEYDRRHSRRQWGDLFDD